MLLINNKPLRVAWGFCETFNLLALKLWFMNRANARAFSGKIFRAYMSLAKRDRWRSLSLDELFPRMEAARIVLEHQRGGGINNPIDELAALAVITSQARPRRVFEIGTFRGRTALNFALNSPPECVVHTLDLPPTARDDFKKLTNPDDAAIIAQSDTGVDYRGKAGSGKIQQLFGDSTTFDFSPYHAQMDLVFVDGAHHYDAVVSDTRNALRMARPGGWIIWHDFANYGDYNDVTRAVLSLLPGDEIIQIDSTQLAVHQKKENSTPS
jgi:predicted O-methyltransferase YrrM